MLRNVLFALIAIGIAVWAAGFFVHDSRRAWQALLHAYFLFLMLGLGGIVFTAIQYCASARWSIVVRRIAEGMGAFVPACAALFLVIVVGGWSDLYAWNRETASGNPPLGPTKAFYMQQWFVIVRGILFFAVMAYLIQKIRGNSLAGDKTKDPQLHSKNVRWSIAFLMLFAYTFSLHCVDMLMALEVRWFSTIFGVYAFSGLFLSSLCVITLIVHAMRRRPEVRDAIQTRHLYDLGTWIMAFSCFMCYIGFSQYMLIWYANLPEETFYLIIRTENGWEYLTALLPLFKWVIPFLVLMPQGFRANTRVQILVCCFVLVGQWLDIYWMIYPAYGVALFAPGIAELGAFLAVLGVFGVILDRTYRSHSVLPMGDPHLKMSVDGSYL